MSVKKRIVSTFPRLLITSHFMYTLCILYIKNGTIIIILTTAILLQLLIGALAIVAIHIHAMCTFTRNEIKWQPYSDCVSFSIYYYLLKAVMISDVPNVRIGVNVVHVREVFSPMFRIMLRSEEKHL